MDERGRLPLPPRYRDAFRDGIVLSQGSPDSCLRVYTEAAFDGAGVRIHGGVGAAPAGPRPAGGRSSPARYTRSWTSRIGSSFPGRCASSPGFRRRCWWWARASTWRSGPQLPTRRKWRASTRSWRRCWNRSNRESDDYVERDARPRDARRGAGRAGRATRRPLCRLHARRRRPRRGDPRARAAGRHPAGHRRRRRGDRARPRRGSSRFEGSFGSRRATSATSARSAGRWSSRR